ncbi:MAG: hypothetical protein ACK2T4_06020 [Candidatus Promineifilaceae bacterium]
MAFRHAAYYLAFLAGQEKALKGIGQEAALAVIDLEIANVRHAWAWAVAELEAGNQAAVALMATALESLYLYYALRSWYQEGADVFAQAATAVSITLPNNYLFRGELLARQAHCLEFTAPSDQALDLYQESLACFNTAAAEREMALPL